MPPASTAQETASNSHRGLGLMLQLGSDYEKKKQKLLQQLQLDYKDYIAKQKNPKSHEAHSQHRGLLLPIIERASIKEQEQRRRSKRETLLFTSEPQHIQASNAVDLSPRGSSLPFPPPLHTERPASRRDAATLTEAVDNSGSTSTRNPGPWRRRRCQIHKPEEFHTSEELSTDEEEEFDLRHRRRRRDRWTQETEFKEDKRTRRRRVNRDCQDIKGVETPDVFDQNNSVLKSDKEIQDNMKKAAGSTRKDQAEFATGLKIGAAEDHIVTQMKKEQYKQELLRQIAEQRRNRIREKKLELRVAATGAADPENEPDRITQFRAVDQQNDNLTRGVRHESGINLKSLRREPNSKYQDDKPLESTHDRALRGNPQRDFSTTLSLPQGKAAPGPGMGITQHVSSVNLDYYRDLTRIPGEETLPRLAPTDSDSSKSPHHAAHLYYGTKNPSDPCPPQHQSNQLHEAQQFGVFEIPFQRLPPVRTHETPPCATGGLQEDKSMQRRESVLKYQEALKQQIREGEERKRREKEEKEQSDAKLKAEQMTYDPWGRSGGGAPIKDKNGNLVSDLKQMHRINNRMSSPRAEARAPFSHQPSVSSHQSSPQQLHSQNRYKEELERQIEENRRKQAEEQERIRIDEEREEKRLAAQRAQILQQYEEEQRKQKEIQNNRQKLSQIHEARTHHTEEEVKQVMKKSQTAPQGAEEREEWTYQREQRQPSPPIPTVAKRLQNLVPSSAVSRLSSKTERSVSAPHVQTVPANVPTPGAGGCSSERQQEVVKWLSALRSHLRKEQKQMELQMSQTEAYRSHLGRRRPTTDAFEFVKRDSVLSPAGSPSSASANPNMRAFNQPKHREVLDLPPIRHHYSRRIPRCFIPREGTMPSESVFLGKEQSYPQGAAQHICDETRDLTDQREQHNHLGNHPLKTRYSVATNQNTRQHSDHGDYSY